jgi:hypothetical protein
MIQRNPSDEQPQGQQARYEQPQPPFGPPPDGTGGYGPPPVKRDDGYAIAGAAMS